MRQSADQASSGLLLSFSDHLCREWGWVAFRGILAVIFGLLAFFWPLATIVTLAIFWGAFAFVDGISAGVTGWRLFKRGVTWWPYLVFAAIGILAGLVMLAMPGVTALALLYIVAFWAILGGVSQIVAAARLRKEIQGGWFLVLVGVVSVLFGFLVILRPIPEGIVAISWMIGVYAITVGTLYLMLAFKLRSRSKTC